MSTFYFIGGIYSVVFLSLSWALASTTCGEGGLLGWLSYVTIESYGSINAALFWSFANTITKPKDQKVTYGLLVAVAQLGSIAGPTVVRVKTEAWGVSGVYTAGSFLVLGVPYCIYNYVGRYGCKPARQEIKKGQTGVLEGLKLLGRHNYVKGIFAVSCLFMVEVTIIDFLMKVLAQAHFKSEYPCEKGMPCWLEAGEDGISDGASKGFARFMGVFGQCANTISLVFSLLGTGFVIRRLGLR